MQMDLQFPPFCIDTILDVHVGKEIWVEVEAAKESDQVPVLSKVKIDGLIIQGYATQFEKLEKKRKDNPVQAQQQQRFEPKYKTKKGDTFNIKLHAAAVTLLPDPSNDLPFGYRMQVQNPYYGQLICNPRDPIPPNDLESVTTKPVLLVSSEEQIVPAIIARHCSSRTKISANDYYSGTPPVAIESMPGADTSALRNPAAFQYVGQDKVVHVVCPIRQLATTTTIVPHSLPGAMERIEALRPFYTKVETIGGGTATLLTRTYGLKAVIRGKEVRACGVADKAAYVDMMTERPMRSLVELAPYTKTIAGEIMDLYISNVWWDIQEWLDQVGIPISPEFGKLLMGNAGDVRNGEFGTETVKKWKDGKQTDEDEQIRNELNENPIERHYAINVSEFTGKLDAYLDPKNQWLWRAVIVRKRNAYNQSLKKRELIDAAIAQVRPSVVKTPEQGDAAVRKIYYDFARSSDKIDGFGLRSDESPELRCMVFCYKPLATRFNPAV